MQFRIARLERQIKRGRVMLAFLGALLAAFVLVAQADPEPKPLVGRSLRLVDTKGRTRFEVQFEREGAPTAPPTLRLVDAQGRTWLSAGLNAGRAHLKLQAAREGAEAVLQVCESGDRDHVLFDEKGAARTALGQVVAPQNEVKTQAYGLTLLDTAGKLVWAVPK